MKLVLGFMVGWLAVGWASDRPGLTGSRVPLQLNSSRHLINSSIYRPDTNGLAVPGSRGMNVYIRRKGGYLESKPADGSSVKKLQGNEVGKGGTDAHGYWQTRGTAILEAMKEYNIYSANSPWALIPNEYIQRFEAALKTDVHVWEERPLLKGEPRDAGIFSGENGKDAIAIHRQSIEDRIAQGISIDELVIHEYGLAAGLPDEFFHVTGPIIARLRMLDFTPPKRVNPRLPVASAPASRGGNRTTATRRVYFKGYDRQPPGIAVYLSPTDSVRLLRQLGPERLVVSMNAQRSGVQGQELYSVIAEDQGKAGNPFSDRIFISDNFSGKPKVVIACSKVSGGFVQCTIWQWLWPEDTKIDRDASSERGFLSMRSDAPDDSTLHIELTDPADSKGLFDMLEMEWIERSDDRVTPPEMYIEKSFVTGDGTFAFACLQYFGQKNSNACVFETKLKQADLIDPQENRGRFLFATNAMKIHVDELAMVKKTKEQLLAMLSTPVAPAAETVAANEVATPKEARRRGTMTQEEREEFMTRAIGAYIRSRPYSEKAARTDASGILLLEVIGAENLKMLAEEFKRASGY